MTHLKIPEPATGTISKAGYTFYDWSRYEEGLLLTRGQASKLEFLEAELAKHQDGPYYFELRASIARIEISARNRYDSRQAHLQLDEERRMEKLEARRRRNAAVLQEREDRRTLKRLVRETP
jgi:hypothetical protein